MNRCLGCMEKIDKHETVCPHCGYTAGAGASEHSHLTPGTLLRDRYLIGRVLGHGGFGVTYIGYDTALERKLAIKEYLPGELATRFPGQTNVSVFDGERRVQYEIGLERFVKEARNLAQFAGQEGIVRIYDSFAEGNTGYIVMEYLQGQTLKQYLAAKGGKLKPDEAIQLILPLLNALKKVHATGIIHRDISPDNIFLTDDGDIKLIDFGAARFASTQHSKSLSVILKPGYAPEEQYRSRGRQGPWTDIYAVGATFYRLITGQTPEEALERTVNDTLKPPSALGVKIGTGIENALMNALNIHAEDRIQQAAEFEAALLGTIKLDRKIVRQTRPDTGHWPTWLKIVTGAASLAFVLTAVLLLTAVISM